MSYYIAVSDKKKSGFVSHVHGVIDIELTCDVREAMWFSNFHQADAFAKGMLIGCYAVLSAA